MLTRSRPSILPCGRWPFSRNTWRSDGAFLEAWHKNCPSIEWSGKDSMLSMTGVDSTRLPYARRSMSCELPVTIRIRAPHGLDILPGWVDLSGPGPGVVVATCAVAAARFARLYAGLTATRGFAPRSRETLYISGADRPRPAHQPRDTGRLGAGTASSGSCRPGGERILSRAGTQRQRWGEQRDISHPNEPGPEREFSRR